MKTIKKLTPILLLSILILAACGPKPEEQVKRFAMDFAQKASKNQIDTLKSVYPDVINADSIALSFNSESIKILPLDDDGINFRIRYSPDASIELIRNKKGEIKVIESRGIFLFPDTLVSLAESWGLWNKKFSDAELSKIIKEQVLPKLKFTSPDLNFFNLHGPVKSMTVSYVGFDGKKYPWLGVWGWKGLYEFNEDGEWLNPKEVSSNFVKITRNDKNQITNIQLPPNSITGGSSEITYNWSNNRPESFVYYTYEGYAGNFVYQDDLISGIQNSPHNPYEMDYEITEKTILTDFQYDEMGNWISCKCLYRYNEYINGTPNSGSKPGIMNREILYY